VLILSGIKGQVRIGNFDAARTECLLQAVQEFAAHTPLLQRDDLEAAAQHHGGIRPFLHPGDVDIFQYLGGERLAGAQLRTNPGFEQRYGWAPTPVLVKGGPRVTNTLGATGVVMYAKTKVPDQAFKVFEWYMGGEYGRVRAETGWGIPPLKSLNALLPEANAFDKARKTIALDDAKYFKPWQASPWIPAGSWSAAWSENIEPLVRGEATMDKFVDNLYASLNKMIADGKAQLGK